MTKGTKMIGSALILVIIVLAAITFWPAKPVIKQEVKVGAVYTLTGIISDIGKAMQEGTEIAKEELNEKGGVNGKMINVIYEDDPDYNPGKAVSAAQKLIQIDKVSVVIDMAYTGLAAMRPIAETNKVPVIDVLDSSDQIAGFGDWVFGSGIYDDGVGMEVAAFALRDLKVTRAAMLVGKDEYLQAVAGGFSREFVSQGGQIVASEEFMVGEKDFRTQLLKIKNSGAQTIFVSHLGEGGLIAKQATEMGYTGSFLGSDPWSLGEVSKVAGDTLNDRTYFGLWKNFDEQTDRQKEFVKRYVKKYGKEPGDYLFYVTLGYDGLMTAAQAIEKSDGTGPGIQKALYQVKNYEGLSGPISIDSSGINRDPKSAIVMYKDGKIVRYKK